MITFIIIITLIILKLKFLIKLIILTFKEN